MSFRVAAFALVLSLFPVAALVAACGSSSNSGIGPGSDGGSETSTNHDAGPQGDSAPPSEASPDSPAGSSTVTFSYTPQWSGATAASVYGGFGQSTDWKQAFVTLTSNGQGGFTGTAQLPAGQYDYLFEVVGDDAAGDAGATYKRFVIDPTNPAYAACPMASPTYDAKNPNPCAELTVPQPAAAPLYHLTGLVQYDGAPIGGYIVLLERDEKASHHFAANRTNSDPDAGTFDLVMAQGAYRVQVQYPTYISQTDKQIDPLSDNAMLRSISSAYPIDGSTAFAPVEVAYHDYDLMAPIDGGTSALPTTFTYTVVAGYDSAHIAVYGPGNDIGDPWYTGANSPTAAPEVFDGSFNTPQATQDAAAQGMAYWWGTSQMGAAHDGGVQWTGESMVFPISFQ